jgi:hypothetical protein
VLRDVVATCRWPTRKATPGRDPAALASWLTLECLRSHTDSAPSTRAARAVIDAVFNIIDEDIRPNIEFRALPFAGQTPDDGDIPRHDAVTTRHDGVTTRHDGVTTRHDGVTTRHDGGMTRHDAVRTRHDGGIPQQDGVRARLDGDVAPLDGIMTRLESCHVRTPPGLTHRER